MRGELWPALTGGLVGVMLGAMFLAPLADRVGRRSVILYSCVAFGVTTLLTLAVDSLSLSGRAALCDRAWASAPRCRMRSASRPSTRRTSAARSSSCSSAAASRSARSAPASRRAQLIAPFGWHAVFVVGGVLPLLLAVLLARFLPESIRFSAAVPGREAEAKGLLRRIKPELGADADIAIVSNDPEGGKATVFDLFEDGRGVATRLPLGRVLHEPAQRLSRDQLAADLVGSVRIHDGAGRPCMTTLYHVGGVIGTYTIGLLMDRLGAHRMVLVALLLAAVGFYTFATCTGLAQWPTTAILDARRRRRHRRASRRHGARVDDLPRDDARDGPRLGARRRPRRLDRRPHDRRLDARDGCRRALGLSRLLRHRSLLGMVAVALLKRRSRAGAAARSTAN